MIHIVVRFRLPGEKTGRDIFVHPAGSATPVFTIDFGQYGGPQNPLLTADRGPAWSADGRQLYVVTVNNVDELPTLRILNPIP